MVLFSGIGIAIAPNSKSGLVWCREISRSQIGRREVAVEPPRVVGTEVLGLAEEDTHSYSHSNRENRENNLRI